MKGQVMVENNAYVVIMGDTTMMYMVTFDNPSTHEGELCFMYTGIRSVALDVIGKQRKDPKNKGIGIYLYKRVNSMVGYQYRRLMSYI